MTSTEKNPRLALKSALELSGADLTPMEQARKALAQRYVAVRGGVSDDDAIDMVRMFMGGKTNREIAAAFNTDVSVPRAIIAYACDRDPEVYRRHAEPPREKDPEPMSDGYILRRIPPIV